MLSKEEQQAIKARLLNRKSEREKTPEQKWQEQQQQYEAELIRQAGEYYPTQKKFYDSLDRDSAEGLLNSQHVCACHGGPLCCIHMARLCKKWLEDHNDNAA